MGRIHVCAHNSSMGVHVHYIHTYASVGSYTRGAGAESCDKMDRAGDYDERFLHDADEHFSWNSEADDVGHRSDFSWRDLATVLTTKIAQKVEINCENVLCLENRHDQIWKKIWQQLTPF